MQINAATRVVAVLGYPIEHSLSPLLHNAALQAQGLNFVYVAAAVAPADIGAAVAGLKALGFAGANVTLPHKQAVRDLVDELSPDAEAVGAVNTIVCRRAGAGAVTLYGDNTDVAGFLAPLQRFGAQLREAPMVVFGAGGAARAVVYALLRAYRPARLTVAARNREKADLLVRDLQRHDPRGCLEATSLQAASLEATSEAVREARLLVNATPLGMYPATDGTPWERSSDFSDGTLAYDLVYNPEETRFLREAAAHGATAIGGLDMLIGQAAAAYVQWTGREMPAEAVRAALRQHQAKAVRD